MQVTINQLNETIYRTPYLSPPPAVKSFGVRNSIYY